MQQFYFADCLSKEKSRCERQESSGTDVVASEMVDYMYVRLTALICSLAGAPE